MLYVIANRHGDYLIDVNWAWIIITMDSAILIAAISAEQRTTQIANRRKKPEILKHESPINWLKGAFLFSIISLLSGFSLAFFATSNYGITLPENMMNFLTILTIGEFLCSLLLMCRVAWFIFEPTSITNVKTGYYLNHGLRVIVRLLLIAFITMSQIVNVLLFYLTSLSLTVNFTFFAAIYSAAVVISFIAMFPFLWAVLFRLKEKGTRKDYLVIICFTLPYTVLSIFGVLLAFGLKLF